MHITDSVSVSVSKMAWEPLTYIGIRMLFLKLFLLLLYLQRFLCNMILCHMPLLSFASSHPARFTCVRISPQKKVSANDLGTPYLHRYWPADSRTVFAFAVSLSV